MNIRILCDQVDCEFNSKYTGQILDLSVEDDICIHLRPVIQKKFKSSDNLSEDVRQCHSKSKQVTG